MDNVRSFFWYFTFSSRIGRIIRYKICAVKVELELRIKLDLFDVWKHELCPNSFWNWKIWEKDTKDKRILLLLQHSILITIKIWLLIACISYCRLFYLCRCFIVRLYRRYSVIEISSVLIDTNVPCIWLICCSRYKRKQYQ